MPTVAPKTPRDTFVGSAGAPSLVFSLVNCQSSNSGKTMNKTYQPADASMSIPYEHRTRLGIFAGLIAHNWFTVEILELAF